MKAKLILENGMIFEGKAFGYRKRELKYYLKNAFSKDKKNPILVDKYLMGGEIAEVKVHDIEEKELEVFNITK